MSECGKGRGHSSTRSVFGGAALTLALVLPLRAAVAQSINGTVVDADNATRLAGVVVLLVDSSGVSVARTLSRTDGSFFLTAPAAGRYALHMLRIGYAPSDYGAIDLGGTQALARQFQFRGRVVRLDTIHVRDVARCSIRPDSTQQAFAVWEASRTALMASLLTRGTRPAVRLLRYDRWLDPHSVEVVRQEQHEERGESTRPFASLPARVLIDSGFVQRDGSGTTYHAPDSEVLLSELFADTHCLQLVNDTAIAGRRIGVRFTPARARADIADISGVLWLDRASAELRSRAYEYTNQPRLLLDAQPGGTMDFLRLPTGQWVVRAWQIRMPVVGIRATRTLTASGAMDAGSRRIERRDIAEVSGIQVAGGEILEVAHEGRILWTSDAADEVIVEFRDSLTNKPLGNVGGSVDGTEIHFTSDAGGVARLTGLRPGRYGISLQIPLLDSLGISSVHAGFPGESVRGVPTVIRVPPLSSAMASVCGADLAERGDAVVYGRVRLSQSGNIVSGGTVRIAWRTRFSKVAGGVVFRNEEATAIADTLGRFHVCGIPQTTPLVITGGPKTAGGWSQTARVPEGTTLFPFEVRVP